MYIYIISIVSRIITTITNNHDNRQNNNHHLITQNEILIVRIITIRIVIILVIIIIITIIRITHICASSWCHQDNKICAQRLRAAHGQAPSQASHVCF